MGTTEKERKAEGRPRIDDPLRRVPYEKPPFTIDQIKKAIPPHCFERSALRSFAYLAHDLAITGILLYLAVSVIPSLPTALRLLAWPLYWVAQGCILTGVWVIAHECGHHAFSESALLDDLVGLVLHSALLVPYFSWKYSHRRHHANTASLERDEVYVPRPRSSLPYYTKKYLINNPPGRFFTIVVTLTAGFPLYLAFNVSGRPYPRVASHFDPNSPIYSDRERAQIFVSDAGLMAVWFVLYKAVAAFGFWWVVRVYGVPLLMVNGWFVLITILHHTHLALPHYDSSEWDWLRGALATVDRDYGLLNRVFHDVTNTHVAHHLFSTIPHYHAAEVTRAIRPVLGDYYHFDGTPIAKAMWREARECVYIEPDAGQDKPMGVFWYRNKL